LRAASVKMKMRGRKGRRKQKPYSGFSRYRSSMNLRNVFYR
jgi:hypothetical protein